MLITEDVKIILRVK